MSVEQLQTDLKNVLERAPQGPLVTATEIGAFLGNEVLPFISAVVAEMADMDATIEEVYYQSEDVLHEESATVFSTIIKGARALLTELRTRAGTDARILQAIREWGQLADRGEQILTEITIPDAEVDDDGSDEDEGEGEKSEPEGKSA
jgi:hypothetical protein